MKNSKSLGYCAITIVAVIYGVSYLARNQILDTGAMGPNAITLFQLSIMAILFAIYNVMTKKSMKVASKDMPMLLFAGLIGSYLFQTLTNVSVLYAGAGIPSLLFGLAAVFSLITSVVVFKKRAHFLSWVAVVAGLVGLYIIMGITPTNFANTNFLGFALSISSIIAWVAYCFLLNYISDKYEKTVVLFWSATAGVIAAAAIAMVFAAPIDMGAISGANIGTIVICFVILGVLNATIAKFMNLFAIKQIGVDMSNIFLNFMPMATLLSVFILTDAAPKLNEVIGGLIIIGSVFLLCFAEKLVAKKQQL